MDQFSLIYVDLKNFPFCQKKIIKSLSLYIWTHNLFHLWFDGYRGIPLCLLYFGCCFQNANEINYGSIYKVTKILNFLLTKWKNFQIHIYQWELIHLPKKIFWELQMFWTLFTHDGVDIWHPLTRYPISKIRKKISWKWRQRRKTAFF